MAAFLLCTVVGSPVEAQLGRLKKAAQDLAKDKLTAKKDSATTTVAPAETAKPGASSKAAAVSYALTTDYIELVLSSVEPAVQYAQRLQAVKQQEAAYAKQKEESDLCLEQVKKSYDPMRAMSMSEKTMADITRLGERSGEAQSRAVAALEKNDRRTYLLVQDTAMVLLMQSAVITMGGKCNVPYAPVAVIDMQVSAQKDASQADINPTAQAKAKLTHTQFGRMRERIALWGMLQADPTMKPGSEGVFTADEHAALQARAADIKRLTPYFKDSTMRWSTWGDVTTW